jgi:hypothetical protein
MISESGSIAMRLVAIKATRRGLVPVPRFWIDRGDHPIGRNATGNPKAPVVRQLQILSDDRGEQRRRVLHVGRKRAPFEMDQHGICIACQRLHQRFARRRIVPIAHRFARARVVVVALQNAAQRRHKRLLGHPKDAANRRANHRHRVLRGHRIVKRRRVEHAPTPHEPRGPGHVENRGEDPIRILRGAQPRPHVDQHRMDKPRVVEIQPARCVLPAHVERKPVHRLAVREPLQALKHHHDRDDARRHRAAPDVPEEIGEAVVREEPMALAVEQAVDRRRRELALAVLRRRLPDVSLLRGATERHASDYVRAGAGSSTKNTSHLEHRTG